MPAAATFERERPFLASLAYRMLGSVADAEDAVQDTYLRWSSTGFVTLQSPRAWFARTCTRICLDRLASAQRARHTYVGEWLPEPLVESQDPSRAELDESLSIALLRTIERLRPRERAAFLLHDVFGYTFEQVADVLDLEPANCRQLASRARKHLAAGRARGDADESTHRRVATAFFEAIERGDDAALRRVLADDVVLHSDGGGKAPAARAPIEGIDDVTRFFLRIFAQGVPGTFEVCWFNGAPGVVLSDETGPLTALQFRIRNGAIRDIFAQRNPDKLRGFTDGGRVPPPGGP